MPLVPLAVATSRDRAFALRQKRLTTRAFVSLEEEKKTLDGCTFPQKELSGPPQRTALFGWLCLSLSEAQHASSANSAIWPARRGDHSALHWYWRPSRYVRDHSWPGLHAAMCRSTLVSTILLCAAWAAVS